MTMSGSSDLSTAECATARIDSRTTEVYRMVGFPVRSRRERVALVRKVDGVWRAEIADGGLVSPPYRRWRDAVYAGVAGEIAGIRGSRLEWPIDTTELD